MNTQPSQFIPDTWTLVANSEVMIQFLSPGYLAFSDKGTPPDTLEGHPYNAGEKHISNGNISIYIKAPKLSITKIVITE